MMDQRKPRSPCTPDIFEAIIAYLYAGILPAQVVELNQNNDNYPTLSTIHKYAIADNTRKKVYTDAREACADMLAEQVIVAADSTLDPQRASNRMKSRQWLAAKLKPKVYGDKLDLDIKGSIDIKAAVLAARRRSNIIDVTPGSELLTNGNDETIDNGFVDPFS